jgi:predicted Zn-dependent protease with MMP-like domain
MPPEMRKLLRNVAVTVEDGPTDGSHWSEGPLGLYQGIPVGERGSAYSMVMPDRISVYRRPLLAACHSQRELRQEVGLTVLHEVGHYFVLGDHEIPF